MEDRLRVCQHPWGPRKRIALWEECGETWQGLVMACMDLPRLPRQACCRNIRIRESAVVCVTASGPDLVFI
jgi:hypothetical protein